MDYKKQIIYITKQIFDKINFDKSKIIFDKINFDKSKIIFDKINFDKSKINFDKSKITTIPLGRWKMNITNEQINNKVDLSNEDHCGPCGKYNLSKDKDKDKV